MAQVLNNSVFSVKSEAGCLTQKRLQNATALFYQKFMQVKFWLEEGLKQNGRTLIEPLPETPSAFLNRLADGVLLCNFLNALYPNSIVKIWSRQGVQTYKATENINAFLQGKKIRFGCFEHYLI